MRIYATAEMEITLTGLATHGEVYGMMRWGLHTGSWSAVVKGGLTHVVVVGPQWVQFEASGGTLVEALELSVRKPTEHQA